MQKRSIKNNFIFFLNLLMIFLSVLSCQVEQLEPIGVKDPSLLLQFKFEETSYGTIYDSSPYGNHGTMKGALANITYGFPSNGNSSMGKCFEWKSNSTVPYGHIVVNTPEAIHNSIYEMTVTGWVFFNAAPAGVQHIISKVRAINGDRSFTVYLNAATLTFSIFYNFAGTASTITRALTANAWHHFACTYKYVQSGTSLMQIYINGAVVTTSAAAFGPIYKSTTPIVIGSDLDALNAPTANRFRGGVTNGNIDELRFYNRMLSPDEITSIYHSQK